LRLVFSARAERDLKGIARWIARDDPIRAESYTEELRAACGRIRDFPLAFPALEGTTGRVLHKRSYGPYLILYEARPRTVRITAILHGRRDTARLI
jgi:toxin ParE1/3/4